MSDYLAIGWEEFCFTIPGWWRPIDLSGDVAAQIDDVLLTQFEGRPEEHVKAVAVTRDKLIESMQTAAKRGIGLVFVEVRGMAFDGGTEQGVLTGAQLVVSRLEVPAKTTGLNHLLPQMVANPDGRLRNLAGMAVFRHESTSDGTAAAKHMYKSVGRPLEATKPVAQHLVRYLVGPVDMGKPWVAMAISINESTVPDGVTRPLLNLVDSIALTVRSL